MSREIEMFGRVLLCGCLLLCWPGLVWAAPVKFRYPMSTSGTYPTAYYDLDRARGRLRDWAGKTKTYDNHTGNDYGVGSWTGMNRGVWIVAGASGTVTAAVDGQADRCTTGKCSPCNGNYVAIRHSDGKVSYYLHMKRGTVKVRKGQTVKCGQQLGQVGSSGCSTGPHLHFGLYVGSSHRDPFVTSGWVSRGGHGGHPSTTCQGGAPPPPPPNPSSCGYVKTRRLGSSGLNIRPGARASGGPLGSVPGNNVCLRVLSRTTTGQSIIGDRTWYRIVYKNITGWISGYYAACSTCGGSPPQCSGSQTRACYTGPSSTRKKGSCRDGVERCSGGKWGGCSGSVTPRGESCNGKDDDCDGSVDEGNPGGGKSCSTGKSGACATGTLQCRGGRLSCVGGAGSAETCNGKDDNCNGQIDEGNPGGGKACPTGKPGICAQGIARCVGGKLACNATTPPSAEICDGKDNDCNGQIDGMKRNCYNGPPNTNGVGTCKGGTQTCAGGQWGGCQSEIGPIKEVCGNKRDDDCDGQTDEGCSGAPVCVSNQTRSCYSGPPNTNGVGSCKAGTQTCLKGQWGACIGEALPAGEQCGNQADENCNGKIDDGCPAAGKCVDSDGDGFGIGSGCQRTQDCNDNDKKVYPGAEEICGNGVDEDCKDGDAICGKLRFGQAGCQKADDCEKGTTCVRREDLQSNRCSRRCNDTNKCPDNYDCIGSESNRACWPRKKEIIPDSDFVRKCKEDADCSSGEYCDRGFCAESGCGCASTPLAPHQPSSPLLWLGLLLLGWRVRRRYKDSERCH